MRKCVSFTHFTACNTFQMRKCVSFAHVTCNTFFQKCPNASALLARVFIYFFDHSLVAVSHLSIQMPKEQVYIHVCDHAPVAAVATASGGPVAAVATDVARSARPHSSIAQNKLIFDEIYACVRCELCADFRIQNVSDPFVSGDWCRQTPLSLSLFSRRTALSTIAASIPRTSYMAQDPACTTAGRDAAIIPSKSNYQ